MSDRKIVSRQLPDHHSFPFSLYLAAQSESDRIRCFVRARKGKAVLFFIFYIFLGPAFSFFVS